VDPAPLGTKKKEAGKKHESRRDGRQYGVGGGVRFEHGLQIFLR